MVSSSCTCIMRLPSPSNSTTVLSGRAAATPMANETPLPIARQPRRQSLDAEARVGPQVMPRHFLALIDPDGIDIDLQHLCLRPELAAATRVVGERAADRDDEVSLLQVLNADLGREAARDADAKRIVVEQPPRRKRRRQQTA